MPRWLVDAAFVGAGGFLGSTFRFGVGVVVRKVIRFSSIPWETLTVNVVGCLAIGALAGATESGGLLRPELRLFLYLGLLGGFTTFSTFGYETFALFRDAHRVAAVSNVFLHFTLGLGAVWLGYALTKTA